MANNPRFTAIYILFFSLDWFIVFLEHLRPSDCFIVLCTCSSPYAYLALTYSQRNYFFSQYAVSNC